MSIIQYLCGMWTYVYNLSNTSNTHKCWQSSEQPSMPTFWVKSYSRMKELRSSECIGNGVSVLRVKLSTFLSVQVFSSTSHFDFSLKNVKMMRNSLYANLSIGRCSDFLASEIVQILSFYDKWNVNTDKKSERTGMLTVSAPGWQGKSKKNNFGASGVAILHCVQNFPSLACSHCCRVFPPGMIHWYL